MAILNNAAAECCLCQRTFMSKRELDAHDRIYEAEHRNALAKGSRTDFGKSFEVADVLASAVFSTGPTVDVKEIHHGIELEKQLAAQPDPLEEVFGYAAHLEVNHGNHGYVSKTNIGDVVQMKDLFQKCSAGQAMLFKSGERYGK
jgi:hypothetical protein